MGTKCENKITSLIELFDSTRSVREVVEERDLMAVDLSIGSLKREIKKREFIPKDKKEKFLKITKNAEGKVKDLKSPRIGAEAQRRTWESLENQISSIENSLAFYGPVWVSKICQRE